MTSEGGRLEHKGIRARRDRWLGNPPTLVILRFALVAVALTPLLRMNNGPMSTLSPWRALRMGALPSRSLCRIATATNASSGLVAMKKPRGCTPTADHAVFEPSASCSICSCSGVSS